MRKILALTAVIPALALAAPAMADSINFAQFGTPVASVASPASGVTNGGVAFTITSPNGSFLEYQEGTSWTGEFSRGENILYDQSGPGAVTIDFASPVSSILHLEAEANAYGAFTETLSAFNGASFLGSVSTSAFNYFDTAHEGTLPYLTFSAPVITSIAISTTNDSLGLALGGTGGTGNPTSGVPEPATWAMLVSGFALIGASFRRKQIGVYAA